MENSFDQSGVNLTNVTDLNCGNYLDPACAINFIPTWVNIAQAFRLRLKFKLIQVYFMCFAYLILVGFLGFIFNTFVVLLYISQKNVSISFHNLICLQPSRAKDGHVAFNVLN